MAATLALGGLLLLVVAYYTGFRINTTASLPRGLYRLTVNDVSRRGELVAFCLLTDALHELITRRGYFARSRQCPGGFAPLLKRAAGLPGDSYRITVAGVTINGDLLAGTAQLPCDSGGRPLPAPVHGGGSLPPGRYLLLGEAATSFDSRYLGPIRQHQIIGRLRPIWVFAEANHHGREAGPRHQACTEPGTAGAKPGAPAHLRD